MRMTMRMTIRMTVIMIIILIVIVIVILIVIMMVIQSKACWIHSLFMKKKCMSYASDLSYRRTVLGTLFNDLGTAAVVQTVALMLVETFSLRIRGNEIKQRNISF